MKPSTILELLKPEDVETTIVVATHFILRAFTLNEDGTVKVTAFNGSDVEFTFDQNAPVCGTNESFRPNRLTVSDINGRVVPFDFI